MRRSLPFLVCLYALGLFSCRDFKQVQVTSIESFKINNIGVEGIDGDLMLKLKNPNSLGFSIYPSSFDVRYSNIYLGKAVLSKRVHIKRNAEEVYSFNLKSDFKNVTLLEVMKLLNGANFKNQLEVKGDLKAGKIWIKKAFPVDIQEKLSLQY
jgi:LEA14-like dessication related protein